MSIPPKEFFLRHHFFWWMGTFLLILAVLSPILESGYIGDDAINSATRGYLLETGKNIWEHSWFYFTSWFREGRFAPVSFFYTYPLFVFLPGLYSYKISIVTLIIFNLIIFAYWIFLFTSSRTLSFLGILLVTLLFQFRIYHDPLYSYHGLQQLVFLFFLSSLIFLHYHLEKERKYLLFLSLLTYTLSLLTYEIAYPFFIIHFLIIYYFPAAEKFRLKRSLKLVLPFMMTSFLFALLTFFLRHQFQEPSGYKNYTAYTPHFDFWVYFSTWGKQISAAFPLSYYLRDPQRIFEYFGEFLYQNFSITIIFIGAGYVILLLVTLRRSYEELTPLRVSGGKIAFWGLLVLILPGAITSLSPRLQKEVDWGVGYLPVYISYYGLITLFLSFFVKSNRWLTPGKMKWVVIPFAVGCGLVGMINFVNDRMVIENQNQFWLYPRKVIENGMEKGLFRYLPENSYLIVDSVYPWESKAFYRMHSGVRLKELRKKGGFVKENMKGVPTTSDEIGKLKANQFPEGGKIFYLYYESLTKEMGYALLGQIKDFWATPNVIGIVTGNRIFVYLQFPFFKSRDQTIFRGKYINEEGRVEPFEVNGEKKDLISSGPNWRLYSFQIAQGFLDLKSFQPEFSLQPNPASLILKKIDQFHLPKNSNTILHTGFLTRPIRAGIAFGKIELKDSFTIEMIVKPWTRQILYAGILGNHPGFKNYEGFVIQEEGKGKNTFTFGYGDGGKWLPGVRFDLIPDQWNYVAILVGKNRIRIFQNGEWSAPVDSKATLKESDMPIHIGNWYYGDRPFQGIIDEVKIVNRRIAEKEIQENWQTLKKSELFSGS